MISKVASQKGFSFWFPWVCRKNGDGNTVFARRRCGKGKPLMLKGVLVCGCCMWQRSKHWGRGIALTPELWCCGTLTGSKLGFMTGSKLCFTFLSVLISSWPLQRNCCRTDGQQTLSLERNALEMQLWNPRGDCGLHLGNQWNTHHWMGAGTALL